MTGMNGGKIALIKKERAPHLSWQLEPATYPPPNWVHSCFWGAHHQLPTTLPHFLRDSRTCWLLPRKVPLLPSTLGCAALRGRVVAGAHSPSRRRPHAPTLFQYQFERVSSLTCSWVPLRQWCCPVQPCRKEGVARATSQSSPLHQPFYLWRPLPSALGPIALDSC